jgi:hypothetical protein
MRSVIPAVTHEDGSGRVQTVTAETNPLFYRLLIEIGKRTGVPVIINTSFNVRGEPIVCTPQEAYRCFMETGIDCLVLENCVLSKTTALAMTNKCEKGFAESDALEAQLDDESPRSQSGNAFLIAPSRRDFSDTTETVLNFYKELPFNYYSSAVQNARQLMRSNQIRKGYPILHRYLKSTSGAKVLDVGCGAGWFVMTVAHYYGKQVFG